MAFDLLHRETDIVRREGVALAREVALEFEHQPRERLGLAPDIGKGILVELENPLEIAQVGLAVEKIALGIKTRIEGFVVVALVRDLADDLLDDVLERDESERRAVLIDDDRHVYLV